MMQPLDPLSQLAMCCGLGGNRRRELKPSRNFYYSPSHAAHLSHHESSWALANNYAAHHLPPQPYLLLTQPVIITTTNPAGLNQTNTMALVQHAQTSQSSAGPGFPYFPIISHAATAATSQPQHHHQLIQPNIVSSQYAIYNMPSSNGQLTIQQPAIPTIQESAREGPSPLRAITGQAIYSSPKALATSGASNRNYASMTNHQGTERKVATLSSEVFRQLELIEKQVDLSAEMDSVEKYGIVITRALDPYSLVPHLKESTLREYNEQYLINDGYVVRFVEIIKRPGQTLGLYIRTISFEDTGQVQGNRQGVVITKIDTDSPVYSSPILHVGDEIISINLVNVNGLSIDNVVVIMSIPRRLVLALRVPRDRLFSMDSQYIEQRQQQQSNRLVTNPLDQQEVLTREMGTTLVNRPQRAPSASLNEQQQYQYQMGARGFEDQPQLPESKQPVLSNIRLGDTPEQSSYFSSSIDAINRELKELRRQRMALSNNEQDIDSTRADF